MADVEVDSELVLNEEKVLEDGEIDDIEEGEITDDVPGIPEYQFSPRQERSEAENDRQRASKFETTQKSRRLNRGIHDRNLVNRNASYPTHDTERWTGAPLSRNYENIPRNYDNFGRERQDLRSWQSPLDLPQFHAYDTNRNFRGPANQFRRPPYSDFNVHPITNSEKYLPQKAKHYKPPLNIPRRSSTEESPGVQGDGDDFEYLLERYKCIQEQLDELGMGKRGSLVDELIDDTFVDIPLDNMPAQEEGQTVVAKIDFVECNLENCSGTQDSDNVTNREYDPKTFAPFSIKPLPKVVRTLSELNDMDLATRGLAQVLDERKLPENSGGPSEDRIKRQNSTGKTKKRRTRPGKYARMKKKAEWSGNRRSSSDTYEKLGVAVKRNRRPNKHDRDMKKMIIRRKQLKVWQKNQALAKARQIAVELDATVDDYLEKPMEVDSDSTEGGCKIVETHPPLPLVEVQPPPPPGTITGTTSTQLMPLMTMKTYDGYTDNWIGKAGADQGEAGFEYSYEIHAMGDENNATGEYRSEKPLTKKQKEEDDDDEASVLALREQLLKSMASKRAAKTSSKVIKNIVLKNRVPVSPEERSRVGSPAGSKTAKAPVKAGPPPKLSIVPPKHEPVVIRLGEDSDDSVDSDEEISSQKMGSLFGGLDSLIKEARQRASKPKPSSPEEKSTKVVEPTTPEALSVLPEEKRMEYKRLKQQLALREGQQQKKGQNQGEKVKQIKTGHVKQQKHEPLRNKGKPKLTQSPKQQQKQHVEITDQEKLTRESDEELRIQVERFHEKLMEQKKLISQDEKLLESTKSQLLDSSKALEEHEARVALLRQQLLRTERLNAVQKDLVNKLQVQNVRLGQRMSTRQSTARELEESLLRSRALLVAHQSKKKKQERRPDTGDVTLPILDPGKSDPLQPSGQSLEDVRERLNKLSQSLQESISVKRKKIKDASKLQRINEPSSEVNKAISSTSASNALSPLKSLKLTEDKLALEKIRLRKLEEELSKRLRESSARHALPRKSAAFLTKAVRQDEERASSDSELLVRKSALRGLTPPVELTSGGVDVREDELVDKVDACSWRMFGNLKELEKLKKIQDEKELKGPIFPDVGIHMALPVQLRSTRCILLNVDDTSLSEQLGYIQGCDSSLIVFPSAEGKNERSVRDDERSVRDEWTSPASGPYRSSLLHFRSYRFSPYYRTKKGLTLDSLTFSHLINPCRPFCSFALHGICSDPECTLQHMNEVVPKDDQILKDLAAYFPPTCDKASGDEGLELAVTTSVEAVTKQYEGKVSAAELRVLFVNQLRKQKVRGIYNVALEPRQWCPFSYRRKDPGHGSSPEKEDKSIVTGRSFSWKNWKRKIRTEINTRSTAVGDDCQEIRYFSENYDSIKTLEKATEENPGDEALWIRLASLHRGSSRTHGNNNDNKERLDKALNVLAQALERNRHSEKLWLKYLELFRTRGPTEEIYEVCEEAVDMAPSYDVWWSYLDIALNYERKVNICIRLLEYLQTADLNREIKSHSLLEVFLYLVQLDKYCGYHTLALSRFQAALLTPGTDDWHQTVASLVGCLACADLCVVWLCYIHLVEFSHLPRGLFDPACGEPARIVCKDEFVFPWKPSGGTSHASSRLLKLFHSALKACSAKSTGDDKVLPSLPLYKNLIALERACGKTESAIRSCQRLLKASDKEVDLWLCLASLEELSHDRRAIILKVYKNALEKCCGHAQVAYSAAKYCLKKNDLKECYNMLVHCVHSKFVLDGSNEGPRTRAKSLKKTTVKPDPLLLFKKLLSQPLPPGSSVPPFQPGVDPANLSSESTYLWLCYCVFLESFPSVGIEQGHKMVQAAYESAIHRTGERKQVKVLWTEYLHYMLRRLKDKQSSADEINEIFHRCLITVLAVTPLPYLGSKSWSDYHFHNEVFSLYRTFLGDSFSPNIYDKYLELFPDNCHMAIQAVECAYKNNQVEKSRKLLSAALLKTPYNILLWKIAIAIELKECNIEQATQLYEHATEVLPLAATLWKDFALFQLAHDPTTKEESPINKILAVTKENGINLEEFLRTLFPTNLSK